MVCVSTSLLLLRNGVDLSSRHLADSFYGGCTWSHPRDEVLKIDRVVHISLNRLLLRDVVCDMGSDGSTSRDLSLLALAVRSRVLKFCKTITFKFVH